MSADADGEIVAVSSDVRYDTGAFADVGPRIAVKSGLVAPGPYRVKSVDVRSRCIYTNKVSAGPFRGFGVPQVTWSHETLIDELAHALGRTRTASGVGICCGKAMSPPSARRCTAPTS